MSVWIPTAMLEFRTVESVALSGGGHPSCLYQKWTLRTEQGDVKFQWRPVPGQGLPLRQGPLVLETPENLNLEFDPSD